MARQPAGQQLPARQADNRRTNKGNVKRRLADFRSGVWMRTLLRDPAAGIMHSCLYFGFLVLFMVTVLRDRPPAPRVPEVPPRPRLQALLGVRPTWSVSLFLVGIGWAIGPPLHPAAYRIRIKSKPEDAVILGTFLVIGLSGFFTEALRIALVGRPAFEQWSFVGYPLSDLIDGWSPTRSRDAHRWLWGVHVVAFLDVPRDPADHEVAPHDHVAHNMYLRDKDRPRAR